MPKSLPGFNSAAAQRQLDPVGRKILDELQHNARIPYAELGRRVGLSTPAVMERVRRLEETGIIAGYRAHLNAEAIGYPVQAFIALHNVDATILSRIARLTRTIPELLECHRVTGNSSYILKVVAASVSDLERIIDKLSPLAATSTSLVLSTVVSDRPLSPRPSGTSGTDEPEPA